MRKCNLLAQKIIAGIVGVSITASAAWASCGGTEGIVVGQVQGLAQTILQKMLDGAVAVIQQSVLGTDRTVSAIKVAVKQEAVASEKKVTAMRSSGEALATSYTAQRMSEEVYGVYNRYRSQGFDPCGASTLSRDVKQREVYADARAVQRVGGEIDAAPGVFGDPAQVLRQRQNEHKALFCTEAEVSAGACSSVGELPGGDSNATLLFKDAVVGGVESRAKNAFINNLFGLPTSMGAFEGKADTPEAQAALADKHRLDAIRSIPMHSLKAIQSDHEKPDANTKSLSEALRDRVAMYFGSTRSTAWAQSLAAQERRGVLVDILKIEGVALKLDERAIKQNARMEANLAGLLVLQGEAVNGK